MCCCRRHHPRHSRPTSTIWHSRHGGVTTRGSYLGHSPIQAIVLSRLYQSHFYQRSQSHNTTCFSSDVTFPLPTDSPSPHQIIPHFTLTLVVVVVVVVAVLVEQAWLFHHCLIHNCDGSSSYIYSYTCSSSSSIFSKGMAIPSSIISPRPNHFLHSLSPLTLVVMVVVVVVVV